LGGFLFKWLLRVLGVVIAVLALIYGGDIVVYHLRGAPQSTVTVNRYVSIPLKGQKMEYDYLGTLDEPCSVSLFAQSGESACWQLRRHPNEGIAN
jgi:hypothetical protein